MALDFPWQLFLQASENRRRQQQEQNQAIAGIGQGIGQLGQGTGMIGQAIAQQRAKQQMQDILSQPDQIPLMKYAPSSVAAANPTAPQMQPNPNVPSLANLAGPLQTLYPDQFSKMVQNRVDPLQQSIAAKNFASAQHLNNLGGGTPGATTSVWRNSETGDVTDVKPNDPTGYVEYHVKPGQALQTVTNTPLQKERADAMKEKTAAWSRMIDNRQINELVKRTGLTGKQQSALQASNLRADRAIEILSKPITWQELALGEIDLAGIMQGGVPNVDEVKNTHFPGWQEKAAEWRTYATGHPTENVPEPIRKKVLGLINDVVKIDNKFLEANARFSKNMFGRTITGGIKPYEKDIDTMTDALKSAPSSGNADRLTVTGFSVTP